MDDQTQIANLMRPYGTVMTPDSFDEAVAPGLRGQLELYRTLAGDVDCVFLGDMAFNAVATSDGARYVVGINIGAAMLIARYAYCLMSDPAMLPGVGDPSGEEVEPYVLETLRVPNKLLDGNLGRYLPRDPTRLEAAQQISMAAYLMLFYHELNHVELGHVGFVQDQLGAADYREITATPISEDDAAVLRALEWEADTAALYRVCRCGASFIRYFAIHHLTRCP
jgi:hypothetical protein